MNDTEFRQAIRERQNGRTLTDVATELRVSVQYLHDVMKCRRKPGRKLLKAMGLRKKVEYISA